MYNQVSGTAMGTKFAPPYACLTIGFLEETKLFPVILKKYFDAQTCIYIRNNYLRYMDDGFIILPTKIDFEVLKQAMNEMHPEIKFTMERGKSKSNNTESINFLDIEVILTDNKIITTDIYYKDTNPHDYLNYHSAHPSHTKDAIPFNLAKRIIVFVSEEEQIEYRLRELENWLLKCEYPLGKIRQAFHRAKLQGPAPQRKKDNIPLVTTYHPNLNFKHMIKTISNLLKNISEPNTKDKFKNISPMLAFKQPPNLSSILTKAKFSSINQPRFQSIPGIKLCSNNRCKLCKLYLQPVNSFETANGTVWNIKSEITCESKNVIYFLSCNSCNGITNYIGQTTNLRNRMNNHISESRTGISTCNFPKHVFSCATSTHSFQEPFFKIFAFMKLTDSRLLLSYENKLFKAGHAVMNS